MKNIFKKNVKTETAYEVKFVDWYANRSATVVTFKSKEEANEYVSMKNKEADYGTEYMVMEKH